MDDLGRLTMIMIFLMNILDILFSSGIGMGWDCFFLDFLIDFLID